MIVEVEAVLNDRPLTYLSSDVTNFKPLTPSDLIYGQKMIMLPHLKCEDDEVITMILISNKEEESLGTKPCYWNIFGQDNREQCTEGLGGNIVLIYDDTARVNWKLAVI